MKVSTRSMPYLTQENINLMIDQAKSAASIAATDYLNNNLGGRDTGSCGFAWVNLPNIHGNSKLAKMLKNAGLRRDYRGSFQIWNPAQVGAQNIDVLFSGALAAEAVLCSYGFEAYAGSRVD
jgi:hypothetical protein